MRKARNEGMALVETAVATFLLLLLLAGGYVGARSGFIKSRAESAAQAQALRAGRHQGGLEGSLAESVIPGGKEVRVRSERGSRASLGVLPLPPLEGRTVGIVSVGKEWDEAGNISEFPRLELVRRSEASVDCWDRGSSSGKAVRGVVEGIVASRAVQ
jgi:hypothetical protein